MIGKNELQGSQAESLREGSPEEKIKDIEENTSREKGALVA